MTVNTSQDNDTMCRAIRHLMDCKFYRSANHDHPRMGGHDPAKSKEAEQSGQLSDDLQRQCSKDWAYMTGRLQAFADAARVKVSANEILKQLENNGMKGMNIFCSWLLDQMDTATKS